MVYFTSHTYRELFIAEDEKLGAKDTLGFFMFVVLIEHILLLLKLLIENLVEDVPIEVQRGERERFELIQSFKKGKEVD